MRSIRLMLPFFIFKLISSLLRGSYTTGRFSNTVGLENLYESMIVYEAFKIWDGKPRECKMIGDVGSIVMWGQVWFVKGFLVPVRLGQDAGSLIFLRPWTCPNYPWSNASVLHDDQAPNWATGGWGMVLAEVVGSKLLGKNIARDGVILCIVLHSAWQIMTNHDKSWQSVKKREVQTEREQLVVCLNFGCPMIRMTRLDPLNC